MTRHACRLLADAQLISAYRDREFFQYNRGRGEYLLRLMALEILLKAGSLRESGELKKFTHNFKRMFEAQADRVQASVQEEFGARGIAESITDHHEPLDQQLDRLRSNYTRARYLYEPSIEVTPEVVDERVNAFLQGDLPIEEWDIVYHTELMELLLEVMLGELGEWVPDWFPIEPE
jgi:hypothetical protein